MAEKLREFTPIAKAVSNRAWFDVTLPPYVDVNQIGVDLRQTDKLCFWGGIDRVHVLSDKHGETSRFVPTVIGMDRNGEALAGKTGLSTQVPPYSATESPNHQPWTPHSSTWIDSTIKINIPETNRLIQSEQQWSNGVRTSEAWAHHIDQAVKHGIKKVGTNHLVKGLSSYEWKTAALNLGLIIYPELLADPSIARILLGVLRQSALLNLFGFVVAKLQENEFRPSLLYGPQLDRALILTLSSLKTPLVKTINKT